MKIAIVKIDWDKSEASMFLKFEGETAEQDAEAAVVGFRQLAISSSRFDFILARQQLEEASPPTQG